MRSTRQEQAPQQYGLTAEGLKRLRDAADPGKPHSYEWYVIERINTPEERVDHVSSLETAIRTYAAPDCEDKRLGVTKDGIAAVDLVIRHGGREWVSEDRLRLDSFKSDPTVAAAVTEIQSALDGRATAPGASVGSQKEGDG